MSWLDDCGESLKRTWPLSMCAGSPKKEENDDWKQWPKISETQPVRPPLMGAPSLDFGISSPIQGPSIRHPVPFPTGSRGRQQAIKQGSRGNSRTRKNSRSRSKSQIERSGAGSFSSVNTNGNKGRPTISGPQEFRHLDGHGGMSRNSTPISQTPTTSKPPVPRKSSRRRAQSNPIRDRPISFHPLQLTIHIPGNELPQLPTFLTPDARSSTFEPLPAVSQRPRSMSVPAIMAEGSRASDSSAGSSGYAKRAVAPMPFTHRQESRVPRASSRYSQADSDIDPDCDASQVPSPYGQRSHSFYARQSTMMLAHHLDLPPPPAPPIVTQPSQTNSPISANDSQTTVVPLALGPPVEVHDVHSPVSPMEECDRQFPSHYVSPLPTGATTTDRPFHFPASTFSTYTTTSMAPSLPPSVTPSRVQSVATSSAAPKSSTKEITAPQPAKIAPPMHSPTISEASFSSTASSSTTASSIDPRQWNFVTPPPGHGRQNSDGTVTTATSASPQPPKALERQQTELVQRQQAETIQTQKPELTQKQKIELIQAQRYQKDSFVISEPPKAHVARSNTQNKVHIAQMVRNPSPVPKPKPAESVQVQPRTPPRQIAKPASGKGGYSPFPTQRQTPTVSTLPTFPKPIQKSSPAQKSSLPKSTTTNTTLPRAPAPPTKQAPLANSTTRTLPQSVKPNGLPRRPALPKRIPTVSIIETSPVLKQGGQRPSVASSTVSPRQTVYRQSVRPEVRHVRDASASSSIRNNSVTSKNSVSGKNNATSRPTTAHNFSRTSMKFRDRSLSTGSVLEIIPQGAPLPGPNAPLSATGAPREYDENSWAVPPPLTPVTPGRIGVASSADVAVVCSQAGLDGFTGKENQYATQPQYTSQTQFSSQADAKVQPQGFTTQPSASTVQTVQTVQTPQVNDKGYTHTRSLSGSGDWRVPGAGEDSAQNKWRNVVWGPEKVRARRESGRTVENPGFRAPSAERGQNVGLSGGEQMRSVDQKEVRREKEKGKGVGRRNVDEKELVWGQGLGTEWGIAY